MSVPCVGIFFKHSKQAFFLFTEQAIKGKNIGFGIEKGKITVQYPTMRGLAYRYVLPPEPNADKGLAVQFGEELFSRLYVRVFPCEDIPEFFDLSIPLLLIAGEQDEIAPFDKNAGKLIVYCKNENIDITVIVKEDCKHHPH